MTQWKTQLLEGAAEAFGGEGGSKAAQPDIKELHAKIGAVYYEPRALPERDLKLMRRMDGVAPGASVRG